jgi:hypothetical protein
MNDPMESNTRLQPNSPPKVVTPSNNSLNQPIEAFIAGRLKQKLHSKYLVRAPYNVWIYQAAFIKIIEEGASP